MVSRIKKEAATFKQAIADLGITQKEFGVLIYRTAQTVNNMVQGRFHIHGMIWGRLEEFKQHSPEKLREMVAEIQKAKVKTRARRSSSATRAKAA